MFGVTTPTSKRRPQRTCIACRRTDDKRAFVRLVCTESGEVEVDNSGKKPGRGAYLCPSKECWEMALKKNRLEYALRTQLGVENRRTLSEYSHTQLQKG